MNTFATTEPFFSVFTEIKGAGKVYSRGGPAPKPFFLTLVNLDHLEKALHDEHSLYHLISLLSPEEQRLFATFAYPKRRREWLGGRLTAKSAVLQLLQIDTIPEMLSALSILPTENGSPRLTSAIPSLKKLPALSISHSDRFAVAMAAEAKTCGIDIQKISQKTERVADRFCDANELQLLRDRTPQLKLQERLTLLWSAKEALKKALLHDQPIIFQGVVLQSLDVEKHFTLHLRFPGDRNLPAEITAVKLEDCFLAYTVEKHHHA